MSKLHPLAPDYHWVAKENLHVTLNFLGDVDESQVPSVCRLIQDSIAGLEPFELAFRGLGCFPKLDKPRVVWIGVDAGYDELVEVNRVLGDALETMRFPKDRHDYRPHLTLGRIRRGGRFSHEISNAVERGSDQLFGATFVDQIVIYSSYLDRSGPTYTPMSRIKLG